MEFPHIGAHCFFASCKKLDFLPVRCDACDQLFCSDHMRYEQHNCSQAYQKNVHVPICPLCKEPVPIPRGSSPDVAVGNHIDNGCYGTTNSVSGKKVFNHKCSSKGCHSKEIVPIVCPECQKNYCFKHRHTVDHNCSHSKSRTKSRNPRENDSTRAAINRSLPQFNNSIDEKVIQNLHSTSQVDKKSMCILS